MPIYGHWQLGSQYTSDGKVFVKLHQQMSDLRRVVCRFDAIYFEEPLRPEMLSGHTNIDTLRVLTGLASHVESFAAAMSITAMRINISSWRKFYIGKMPRTTKSKDWKAYSMERSLQLGFKPKRDDEADALGILDYSCELKGITPPWRTHEILRPMLAGSR